MPKKRGFAAMSDVEREDRRRKDVFSNPPSPSSDKAANMANALKWHAWGWSMVDSYTKAGVSKKNFKRLAISHLMIQLRVCINLHDEHSGLRLTLLKVGAVSI